MIHALRELASIVFAAAADPSFVAPSTTTGIFAATGGGTELRLSSPSVCLSVCLFAALALRIAPLRAVLVALFRAVLRSLHALSLRLCLCLSARISKREAAAGGGREAFGCSMRRGARSSGMATG
mmetsp:Transcript_2176/g.3994  ORF Transcript_2176/g.3994 Transcript_2176/m.3994 type:complete len:125 (+) Transcript_2176:411-785(+)